jgi:hypothetical protein
MAAAIGVNVAELSAQARRDRIEAGQVEPQGVVLRDGNQAGVGDWITTRRNDRRLPVRGGRDWVKNGDAWHVIVRHPDGSLTAAHLEHRGQVRLPAEYARRHVELLYATTTNRAQGSTVDTAHPLITPEMGRENLYVVASRARERTTLYVTTHELPGYDPDERLDRTRNDARMWAAREVLENILAREGNERSATETIRDAQHQAASLATLVPRYVHAADLLAAARYQHIARQVLGNDFAERAIADPAWLAAVRALGRAEAAGWQPEQLLAATLRQGELATADSAIQSLAWRIGAHTKDRTAPPRLDRPTAADAARYADLLRRKLDDRIPMPAIATLTAIPAALTASAASSTARSPAPQVPPARLTRYADASAVALGLDRQQLVRHRAWPHLAAALAAADRNSHDLADLLTHLTEPTADPQHRSAADAISRLSRTMRRLLHSRGVDRAEIAVLVPLRHTQTAAAALGIDAAERARSEPAWPALTAALNRAERAGHHPTQLLAQAADAPDVDTADSLTETLAAKINHALAADPSPAVTAPAANRTSEWWRTLAWTLKAIENTGTPAETVLTDADTTTVHQVVQQVVQQAQRAAAQAHAERADDTLVPPWIPVPPTVHADDRDPLRAYATTATELISQRVQQLTDDAANRLPAWTALLGPAPDDPQQRSAWLRHIGIIAAYRDQYQITSDDPRQILGPHIEPGHAGHHAYRHAVDSVLAARTFAGAELADRRHEDDPAHRQLANDLYASLPETERAAISHTMAERLGALWFGSDDHADDHAVVHPGYADQLAAVLAERGHLIPVPTAANEPNRTARHQPAHRPLEADLAERRRPERGTPQDRTSERTQQRDEEPQPAEPRRRPLLQPPSPEQRQGPQIAL